MYEGIKELLQSLNQDGHKLIVITHQHSTLLIMTRIFEKVFDFEITCEFRNFIRENVNAENAQDYILIGSSDDDLHLAAGKKC